MSIVIHQKIRNQIVEASDIIYKQGYILGSGGNMSIRIPEEELIAITSNDIDFEDMQPEEIIIMDLEGNVIDGEYNAPLEKLIHTNIYKRRPDVNAIIMTNATYCTAMAIARKPIPPVYTGMIELVGGGVLVAEYDNIGSEKIVSNILRALGSSNAVLISNHGFIAVSDNWETAFDITQICEKTSKAVLLSQMIGGPVSLKEDEIDQIKIHNFARK